MTKSLRLEMPYYLIQSYADLSLAQTRYIERYPAAKYPGFQHNFALLCLNAAIVEGTLRSILHWHLLATANEVTEKGIQAGQTEPNLAERTLIRLRLDVDTSDTWSKLKSNFKYVFGKSVADVVTQPLIAEIEHLFTIVIAQPTDPQSSFQLQNLPRLTMSISLLFSPSLKLSPSTFT